jgi:hypothetical protein
MLTTKDWPFIVLLCAIILVVYSWELIFKEDSNDPTVSGQSIQSSNSNDAVGRVPHQERNNATEGNSSSDTATMDRQSTDSLLSIQEKRNSSGKEIQRESQ